MSDNTPAEFYVTLGQDSPRVDVVIGSSARGTELDEDHAIEQITERLIREFYSDDQYVPFKSEKDVRDIIDDVAFEECLSVNEFSLSEEVDDY